MLQVNLKEGLRRGNIDGYILIDLSWIIYRGYFAFKHLYIKDKSEEDGVRRTGHYFYAVKLTKSLLDYYKGYKIIYCKDEFPEEKHKIYPSYKAGRAHLINIEKESNLILRYITQIPDVYGAVSEKEEADSVMYSLAVNFSGNKPVWIYSGDDDLLQTVRPGVYVARKFEDKEFVRLGMRYCVEKFGVYPSQLPLFRALRGDSSDNLPGYTRFPKRIAVLMAKKYKTPEEVINARIPVTKDKTLVKYWRIIKDHPDILIRNFKLMKLTTVNVSFIKFDDEEFLYDCVDTFNLKSLRGLYRSCRGEECLV